LGKINEFSAKELIKNSIRKKTLSGSGYSNARPTKYLHRTKNFVFRIKDYDVNIRLEELPVISKMKGSDADKLDMALGGDIKVGCTCPDYSYGGWKYIGTQLDYSTYKENRPPDVRNPKQDGTICKHIGHILSNISKFKPKMLELMSKSRDQKYKVVKENEGEGGGTTSAQIGTFIQHDYDFIYPELKVTDKDIKEEIDSDKDSEEIIKEFTKMYRMKASQKEDMPRRIVDLKFGDVLFFKDESDLAYRYERYLVVKNSANRDYSICWDYDDEKFHVIMNHNLKTDLLGRMQNHDPTLAKMLRQEHREFIATIENEPRLYLPWK